MLSQISLMNLWILRVSKNNINYSYIFKAFNEFVSWMLWHLILKKISSGFHITILRKKQNLVFRSQFDYIYIWWQSSELFFLYNMYNGSFYGVFKWIPLYFKKTYVIQVEDSAQLDQIWRGRIKLFYYTIHLKFAGCSNLYVNDNIILHTRNHAFTNC